MARPHTHLLAGLAFGAALTALPAARLPAQRAPSAGGAATGAPSMRVRSTAVPRAGFVLTSPDVAAGGRLDRRHEARTFGCAGENVSPALAWRGAPAGTKSYAVTLFDPDAPTGSGFWHWIVYNLPATTTSLPAGAGTVGAGAGAQGDAPSGAGSSAGRLPSGAAQAATDYGAPGYGGPCPPPGDGPHRYVFTVHALSVPRVDVPAGATAAVVGFTLHAHTLATASLTARYERPRTGGGAGAR